MFTSLFEILIITIVINYLLSFFWNSRSRDLILGLFSFLLIIGFATLLKLPVLHKIIFFITNAALIGIVIIFQPELRATLAKFSLKGTSYREITEFDKFLEQLSQSVYRFSEKQIGALIVLANEDSLDEFSQKSILLNANFSSELLESLFVLQAPLHDGAVIIKDVTIVAASVILPLADDTFQVVKKMGTRHRAALGMSQITDALLIVVSEETGKVSIARDGIITSNVKIDRFKGIIRSLFSPPTKSVLPQRFNLKEWWHR